MESNEITNELNREVFNTIQITSQENMIIKSMDKFYTYNNNVHLFLSIVNSNANISIRLIDYFITKYCKKNKVSYKLNNDAFNVFISYKQQLKMFKKKYFDPFSRGDRTPYFINDTCIITTVGQLNFFKWFISKNIHNYLEKNKDCVEYDMNKKTKIEKPNKIKKANNIYKINKSSLVNKPAIVENNIINNNKINNIIVTFN